VPPDHFSGAFSARIQKNYAALGISPAKSRPTPHYFWGMAPKSPWGQLRLSVEVFL
jgi:hypothetical protein